MYVEFFLGGGGEEWKIKIIFYNYLTVTVSRRVNTADSISEIIGFLRHEFFMLHSYICNDSPITRSRNGGRGRGLNPILPSQNLESERFSNSNVRVEVSNFRVTDTPESIVCNKMKHGHDRAEQIKKKKKTISIHRGTQLP